MTELNNKYHHTKSPFTTVVMAGAQWVSLCQNYANCLWGSMSWDMKEEMMSELVVEQPKLGLCWTTFSIKLKPCQFGKNESRNGQENFCHHFSYYGFGTTTYKKDPKFWEGSCLTKGPQGGGKDATVFIC